MAQLLTKLGTTGKWKALYESLLKHWKNASATNNEKQWIHPFDLNDEQINNTREEDIFFAKHVEDVNFVQSEP